MVDTGAPVGPGSHASHGTADGGAFEQSEIGRCLMNAMKAIASCLTFSHTGVEQAIEACAKVAESVRDRPGHTIGHDACTHRDGERVAANEIAAAIRATLPAQSPDDIAYAGAVQGEESQTRKHVMPGDPGHLGQTALQWYLGFDFGCPHTVRESNVAIEGFKDGYRACLAASPVNVEGLSEKLFVLSHHLRASGFLDDDKHHAAYEAVVAAFQALSPDGER